MDAWEESNTITAWQSVGERLDQSGYKGELVIKSPWQKAPDGNQRRMHKIFGLIGLELAYEEAQSGTRSEPSSGVLLSNWYESTAVKPNTITSIQARARILF